MTLTSARSKLHDSFQVVNSHWESTKNGWNDQVGRQFEADYWASVQPAVESALRAMDRLSVSLTQMRLDCE